MARRLKFLDFGRRIDVFAIEQAWKRLRNWNAERLSTKDKEFILKKVGQARTLAERVAKEPEATNFDVLSVRLVYRARA
jgi:hypothetical protein